VKITGGTQYPDIETFVEIEDWRRVTPSAWSAKESLQMHRLMHSDGLVDRGGFVALYLQPVGSIQIRQN